MHDPSACSRVLKELEEELAALGVDRAADVIGQAHGTHGRFSRAPARPV
jgi:dihydroorotate dehydrogenase (NAD+) catalytic subunit